MPNHAKTLAKIILKKLDGRTQKWLSENSNVSASVISRMMSGERLPDLENLMAIADALGMQPNELLNPVFRADRIGPDEKAYLRERQLAARKNAETQMDRASKTATIEHSRETESQPTNSRLELIRRVLAIPDTEVESLLKTLSVGDFAAGAGISAEPDKSKNNA
jgi:transcriptional regulator with XRE-family HTH domain